MEPLFLFSDVPEGYGDQCLRGVVDGSYPVVAFVKRFETIGALSTQYPKVIWIAVDIEVERSDGAITQLLNVLPTFSYIINFSGSRFQEITTNSYQNLGISFRMRERGRSELALNSIVYDDDKDRKVLLNVVEVRSDFKKASTVFAKLGKGTKKKDSGSALGDDITAEETSPLLRGPSFQDPSADEEGFFAFILRILKLCCPCLFPQPERVYSFRTAQDLHREMQYEQLNEIQEGLKKVHEESLKKWNKTLDDLQRKESRKMEELVTKINDQKEKDERDLSKEKDAQNAKTYERLSGGSSEAQIQTIVSSRERQTKSTVKYNADRRFKEGQALISKQVDVERVQLREKHYSGLLAQQCQKLSDIHTVYQKKTSNLMKKHFNTRA